MLLLQCTEQSDGEENVTDSETSTGNPRSSQHTASMAATVVTASHALSSRSTECASKAISHSIADGLLRTLGGTAAQSSSPLSPAGSMCLDQHRAEDSKKKLLRRGRVRTTRCQKCINCLAPDCGKCYSCRSV